MLSAYSWILNKSFPGTVKGERSNVKRWIVEGSSSKTVHGARFTNNGLPMWAVATGISVISAMIWTMVQLVQASAEQGLEPQRTSKELSVPTHAEDVVPRPVSTEPIMKTRGELPAPTIEALQGPALTVPEEMVAMFQQRKEDLERREKAVRTSEGQLAILKAEVAQILSKVEAIEKRRLEQEKAVVGQQASRGKQGADTRTQQLGQLVKMYESMPAEEAAARIERMTDRKALEILRLLKSKSAGAILAQVKADRAAKLTEEFLTAPQEPTRH
jgi:flagellar motility protein MotE (MotC chaperone)